jgi:hypothetical protein
VEETDAEGADPRQRSVCVIVLRPVPVRVKVLMSHTARMHVFVSVEAAASPPPQEPDREDDDEKANRHIGRVPHDLRQVAPQEQEGYSDDTERQAVPQAPSESESDCAAAAPPLVASDEACESSHVVGIGRVAEPE